MKVLFCNRPGEFEYRTKADPVIQPGRTVLKIKRIGICGTDLHAFEGTQPFFDYPRILGHELAAEIVQTDRTGFVVGEAVTFIPYFACGRCVACRIGKTNCCARIQVCGVHVDGGMAEYLSVPSSSLLKCGGLGFDELALVEPLAIGAHGIRRAGIVPGETILVVGAGPIGLGAMEFARIAGAKVIAMDINDERLAFCAASLHVDFTVNPAKEDGVQRIADFTGGDMPTAVIDATGSLKAIQEGFRYIAHGGRYVLIGLQKGEVSFSHPEFHKREATLMSSRNATEADFEHVMRAMEKGSLSPATYITHRIAFDQVKDRFASLLRPENGVVKAMVHMPD